MERKFSEVIKRAKSPLPPTPSMRAVITETINPEINPVTWVISCSKIFRLMDNARRVSDVCFRRQGFFNVLVNLKAQIHRT
jgi:hypothetical protein